MLVLSRRNDEQIVIGGEIVVTVMSVQGNRVQIGIDAPRDMSILREELQNTVNESNFAIAAGSESAKAS